MSYHCYFHNCGFKTNNVKLRAFHEKYECISNINILKRYTPEICDICGNCYTSGNRLLKHSKKHTNHTNADMLELKLTILGDLWNIIFGYVNKYTINTGNMWYYNSYDILNCLYIKNNFSFNNIRCELTHTMLKLLQYNRTKILKLLLTYTTDYIPSKIEYTMLINSNIPHYFIYNCALKNVGKDIEMYKYIVEERIIHGISIKYCNNLDKTLDTFIKMGKVSDVKNIIEKYIYKGSDNFVHKSKLNLYFIKLCE
jgi:hypothetical protein